MANIVGIGMWHGAGEYIIYCLDGCVGAALQFFSFLPSSFVSRNSVREVRGTADRPCSIGRFHSRNRVINALEYNSRLHTLARIREDGEVIKLEELRESQNEIEKLKAQPSSVQNAHSETRSRLESTTAEKLTTNHAASQRKMDNVKYHSPPFLLIAIVFTVCIPRMRSD